MHTISWDGNQGYADSSDLELPPGHFPGTLMIGASRFIKSHQIRDRECEVREVVYTSGIRVLHVHND